MEEAYDFSTSFYKSFCSQVYENEYFDVIFDVQGKELYAHRHVLAYASPIFKELFNKNRRKSNDLVNQPVRIEKYTYDEFKEFIRCIYCLDDFYSGGYPDDEKLFAIIELSHIYQTNGIKEQAVFQLRSLPVFDIYRNEQLTENEIKEVFETIEFAHKYSLMKIGREISKCLYKRFLSLNQYTGFVNLEKSAVEGFVAYIVNEYLEQKEELCKAIYRWGEHQAMVNDEMPAEEKNQLVLHYIKDILPYFSLELLLDYFVHEKSLISFEEANKYKTIYVSVTSNDNTIAGSFIDSYSVSIYDGYYDIYQYIRAHEKKALNDSYGNGILTFWYNYFKIPTTPSTVEKTMFIDWYLVFDRNGYLN